MGHAAKPLRHHRPRTVAFPAEAPSCGLWDPTNAFVAFVLAFLLARGSPLLPKARGREGGGLTRHSHSARLRLGGRTRGRLPCPPGTAVFPGVPPCVLRSHTRRPAVARDAWLATHGGRSLAWGAGLGTLAPRALARVIGACGPYASS
jgi:hypothetical protein